MSMAWRQGIPIVMLLIAAASPRLAAAQEAPDGTLGKRLFDGQCSVCHGSGGNGGEAPDLTRPRLPRAPDDNALRSLIETGLPPRMPGLRRLSEGDMGALVRYVRSLARVSDVATVGDAQKGRTLYDKLTCGTCHVVNGQGGTLGPVLSEIGLVRGATHLRQALVEPGAALPIRPLPPSNVPLLKGFTEYLPVRIVTRDGREVRGVRVNEDAVTIQVRDSGNRFYSFRKDEVKTLEKEAGKSLMPSYQGRLTAAELDDLVAYLSSLRGAQ
jgi:putative heme-binding domain-containing protein